MHQYDINRVEFYSKEDLAGTHMLEKADKILRKDINKLVTDINDILEYYHIKKYLDNEIFLKKWTNNDIQNFQEKCKNYDQLIKQFFAKINNENILEYYNQIIGNYIDSFWKIINSLNYYKNISKTNFHNILQKEPFLIDTILEYKGLVEYYKSIIRAFLLNNKQSAEILLSIYEKKKDFNEKTKYLPSNLSVKDKEQIIFNYLEGGEVNLNYLKLIENARDGSDFKVSDKARLRARKLHRYEIENLLKGEDRGAVEYGVSITFPENMNEIKNGEIDENNTLNYQYSADFILKNNQPYSLFRFFDILFEYVDEQQRIKLLSKKNQIDAIERFVGIQSKNEYFVSTIFHLSHITSQMQIFAYDNLLCGINMSIEEILKEVFTKVFQEKYNFPHNANFITPISTNSFLEKIRIIAPEFESILKQYKLFVEDGTIDFELLQISSKPTKIKDIPSLNNDKYIYLNEENTEIINCVNIFFSDQNILTYVEPFKEKKYESFFELLANEEVVKYDDYEQFQKQSINYLIDRGFVKVDDKGFIEILNYERLYILRDLYINEYGSFYHYPKHFEQEVLKMKDENMVFTETSLLSKPEQAYFNFILNKSEYTNGLDLRNRYSHGTQPDLTQTEQHKYFYYLYLKLIVLVFLKIEDDLLINNIKSLKKM